MDGYADPTVDPIIELGRPTAHDVVLDYGCGVGRAAFAVAPFVRSVEAVESNEEILREAERLSAELGLTSITFRRADLPALPFEDRAFGLIVCRNVLHGLLEPVAALREMRRVLARSGRIVVYDTLVDEASDRYLNEMARLREPNHWRYYLAAEYEELFGQAGLKIAERVSVRRSVDLDYWIEAGQVPAHERSGDLIRERLRNLPLAAQLAMDVAYSDRHVSFSYNVIAARLEP